MSFTGSQHSLSTQSNKARPTKPGCDRSSTDADGGKVRPGPMLSVSISLAVILYSPATASDMVDQIIGQAALVCSEFEGGAFSLDPGAITYVDLSGDGREDEIIDESAFSCAGSHMLYCGSGGCMVHAIVDGHSYSWLSVDWDVIQRGSDRILLLVRDGLECGSTGTDHCYEAVRWNGETFLSVGDHDSH